MSTPAQPPLIRFAKRVLGKNLTRNGNEFLYYSHLSRKRNDMRRVPLFFSYFLYKIFKEYLINPEKIVTVNGYKMKVIPEDIGISKELMVFKIHEPLATEFVKRNIKNGMVCFDIGCNIGYYALLESYLVGNEGKVVAFEPSPTNFEYSKENLSINKISNVKIYNYAIGDANTQAHFLARSYSNLSRIVNESDSDFKGDVINVPLVTLDTFVAENSLQSIDFIRMDIEGYEYNAYKGMNNTIKRFKPDLMMEVHVSRMGTDKTNILLNKLKEDGYEVKHFSTREVDFSWIANIKKDVREITLKELIHDLQKKMLPSCFHLYLINKNKKE